MRSEINYMIEWKCSDRIANGPKTIKLNRDCERQGYARVVSIGVGLAGPVPE